MKFIADTVAIIRHFSKIGKIGVKAKKILQDADKGKNFGYISIISIVEIMYLAERNRIPVDLEFILNKIQQSDNYTIVDLSVGIVEVAKKIEGLELHDRLIVATGKYYELPMLSSDKLINDSNVIKVIWK